MSETRRKRETAALIYLVFGRNMEISDAMDLMAGSHFSTIRGWATRGRAQYTAFEAWLIREIDRAKLAEQLEYWRRGPTQ